MFTTSQLRPRGACRVDSIVEHRARIDIPATLMTEYTPEQRATYERVKEQLIAQGFAPDHADSTAHGRALGFEIPPPKRNNGSARRNDGDTALPQGQSVLSLVERTMTPIQYLNDPWAPEGLNINAGRPKLGKSTLLRQKQAAIAVGAMFWGTPCTHAPCVYLSLEEGDRLTRAKFEMAGFPREALANIEVFFEWPRGVDGVLQLHRLLDARPEVRHVGIDSLTRFRTVPDARTPAFQADYDAVNGLHELAKARPGIAIDLVHHTRKMKTDDAIEDISGTFGLSAACDSYWILRHHEDGAVLHVGGRLWDRDVHQFSLKRGQQRWELVGEFDALTEVQRTTLQALKTSGGQSPTDGAKFWGISRQSMLDRLIGLVKLNMAYSKAGIYYAK